MAINMNKAYTWAINTCNAPNIGYPPDGHSNYRNAKTVNGITYYDCSSFINYALLAGGFSTPAYAPNNNAFTTYSMPSALSALGFTKYTVGSSFVWKAGDIGLSTEHTEMCYQGGTGTAIFMGSHTSNATLANQVSIGSSSGDTTYKRTFPYCYRYGEGGAVQQEYSAYVIAAICGNFWRESNVNPGVWESLVVRDWTSIYSDNTGGYGLGQWTNVGTSEGRLYKLHQYLVNNGYAVDSMEGQAAYIIEEDYWTPKSGVTYNTLTEFLESTSTDLDSLTEAWMLCWEGINDGTLSERQEHARSAYNYIVAHANDTSITTYINENRYLSESEILNNCVMLYRLFGGVGGGGGTVTKATKSLPIWMMIKYRV